MNIRRIRDIDYQLLPGSERKTTDIVIERNGMIVVRPPKGYSPEKVDAVVESKRLWIYKNLAEWQDLNATAVVREWVNGETFLYLGASYRLSLVTEQTSDLKLKEGRFYLQRSLLDGHDSSKAKQAFEFFYTQKGLQRIKKRIDYFAPKAGVVPGNLSVKDMGFRWASCSQNNALSFHWKCIMAPVKIIDYVIIHELCHIHHRNHSDAFWNEVDKIMPDYRERKLWLKNHGASLIL